MGIASSTVYLIAHHAKTAVYRFLNVVIYVIEVTRPTRTTLKLGSAIKQLKTAANTGVNAFFFVVPVRSCKTTFCAMLTRNSVLLLGKLFLVIAFGF